jgi:predicted O-methyltransferase YrrM
MFPKIVQAYANHGYRVDLGNPSRLYAILLDGAGGRRMATGGGLSVADVMLFTGLSRAISPKAIFVIGNAFGLSTFVLAELFPEALIDVIDAESEGADNLSGSELTRSISAEHYPNVNLTAGYSPQDIPRAVRADRYQLVFVDGLHTNTQMVQDFRGVLPILSSDCVVVFHDVALCGMQTAWAEVRRTAESEGFRSFELPWTPFGLTAIARGTPAAEQYLSLIAGNFEHHRYHLGTPSQLNAFPRILTHSPIELFLLAKQKLMRML